MDKDIVIVFVFSIVMLLFMIYPSLMISKKLQKRFDLSLKTYNILAIFLTIFFSLLTGLFLKYY